MVSAEYYLGVYKLYHTLIYILQEYHLCNEARRRIVKIVMPANRKFINKAVVDNYVGIYC